MGTPLRLLLVEDSVQDAALLVRTLRRAGYDVVCARVDTAAATSAALDQAPWDLMIADHTVPGFGPAAALALIRQRGLDLPLIILSGTIAPKAAVQLMRAGAKDVIFKDDRLRLLPAIERELQQARERKQAERALEQARVVARELARVRQQQVEEAEALASVSTALAGSLQPTELYRIILEQASRVLPCSYASVLLYQEGWFVVAACWGQPHLPVGARLMPVDGSIKLWWQTEHDVAAYLPDTHDESTWREIPPWVGEHRPRSVIAVPLRIDGLLLGSFEIYSTTPQAYEDRHLRLAERFAERAVQALRNARLYAAEQAARAEAQDAEEKLRAIIGASPLPIISFDRDGLVRSWNAAAERVLGWRADEVIGRLSPMVPQEQLPESEALHARLLRGDELRGVEVRRLRKDGSWIDVELAAAPLRGRDGTIVGTIAVFVDITERIAAQAALRHQATHDGLTGLPNRAHMHQRLEEILQAAHGSGEPVGLLLLDLDRLNEVNDTLGHAHGDQLLQQLAARLRALVPPGGVVARLAGDEFAMVLPHAGGPRASATARAIQDMLHQPFALGGLSVDMEASIGIALSPDHATDAATLLRHADVALQAAKRTREGFAFYTSKRDTHSLARLSLLGDLRRGIEQGQLFLVFQPQLRVADRRICGVEALVRWQHPLRGLVLPDQFIGLAESTGLIRPLTCWVLEAALAQCGAWRRAGLELPVAVNLSARNLHDDTLPGEVTDLLLRYQVPPGQLTLEITESAIMDDAARALVVLTRLSNMGIRLEIDDFGTGYSSLGYLKRLPVNGLKVDRSFVQHLVEDANDAAIVASTVGLAHSLGLEVVAEGVEGQDALHRLATLGCDVAQGYYLSRPLPAPALEHWLAVWAAQQAAEANLRAAS